MVGDYSASRPTSSSRSHREASSSLARARRHTPDSASAPRLPARPARVHRSCGCWQSAHLVPERSIWLWPPAAEGRNTFCVPCYFPSCGHARVRTRRSGPARGRVSAVSRIPLTALLMANGDTDLCITMHMRNSLTSIRSTGRRPASPRRDSSRTHNDQFRNHPTTRPRCRVELQAALRVLFACAERRAAAAYRVLTACGASRRSAPSSCRGRARGRCARW
jgi:hypothetical protein